MRIVASVEVRDCVHHESAILKCYQEETCTDYVYIVTIETEYANGSGDFWSKEFETTTEAVAYMNEASAIEWMD